jgi:hypothetical protein
MSNIGKGFNPSAFGNTFEEEVRQGCIKTREGKRGAIQDLARYLVAEADHRQSGPLKESVPDSRSVA